MNVIGKFFGAIIEVIFPGGKGQVLGVARWFLHLILIGLVIWGMYALGSRFGSRVFTTTFRQQWGFVIAFVPLYLILWFGFWLYKVLFSADAPSDFPDIDEAWEQGLKTLTEAGLRL